MYLIERNSACSKVETLNIIYQVVKLLGMRSPKPRTGEVNQ